MAKLQNYEVKGIIEAYHLLGATTRELADSHEVSIRQVQKIVKGDVRQKVYAEAMAYVAHIKELESKRQSKQPEPITVINTSKGNSPFEFMRFSDKNGNSERQGVFIDSEAIHNGMLGAFTPTQLKTMLTIFAHMDKVNTAFPSQERIAKLSGMSKSTVNKNVQDLDGMQVNEYWAGEPKKAVEREKQPAENNPYEMTVYHFAKELIKNRSILESEENKTWDELVKDIINKTTDKIIA